MWDFVDSHSLSAPVGKKSVTRSDFEGDQVRFACFSNFVESWCFTNPKNGKLASNIPSHKEWLLVLSAMKGLSQKLIMEKEVLTHLCLRKCNQDPVENLHSQIRGYNGFNDHPTLPAYVNACLVLLQHQSSWTRQSVLVLTASLMVSMDTIPLSTHAQQTLNVMQRMLIMQTQSKPTPSVVRTTCFRLPLQTRRWNCHPSSQTWFSTLLVLS
ncbi:hypothetical protein ACOMHN_057711 [Nucella lapillus]